MVKWEKESVMGRSETMSKQRLKSGRSRRVEGDNQVMWSCQSQQSHGEAIVCLSCSLARVHIKNKGKKKGLWLCLYVSFVSRFVGALLTLVSKLWIPSRVWCSSTGVIKIYFPQKQRIMKLQQQEELITRKGEISRVWKLIIFMCLILGLCHKMPCTFGAGRLKTMHAALWDASNMFCANVETLSPSAGSPSFYHNAGVFMGAKSAHPCRLHVLCVDILDLFHVETLLSELGGTLCCVVW